MKHSAFVLSALLLALPAPAASSCPVCSPAEGLPLCYRSNGVYSLSEAAAAGDEAVLKARLSEGENPNQVDEVGSSPLHYAAMGESARVLQLLLEAGADTAARDAGGRTPRELCHHEGLLRQLAQAEKARQRELAADALIDRGDEAGLRAALAAGVSPNARSADNDACLLLHAAAQGQVGMVRALLEAGARVDAVTVNKRLSALHIAAARGDADLIHLLLAAKADPLLPSHNGASALHDAVWHRHMEALRALLPAYSGINFSPRGGPHDTPLNMAIIYGREDCVRAFLEAGFDPNDTRLKGEPPLIIAVRHEQEGCVRLLLEAGADKQMADALGKTAMDYATSTALAPLLR